MEEFQGSQEAKSGSKRGLSQGPFVVSVAKACHDGVNSLGLTHWNDFSGLWAAGVDSS